MSETKPDVFLLLFFLSTLTPLTRGDSEVSCVSMESCILPCSFQNDTDVVIHWIQVSAGNSPVHSFYYNKDQLPHQDQRFRNRTSLFTDQISGGNASLQLTGLQVQDQGRYKCYTSTTKGNMESFINLKVDGEKHIQLCNNDPLHFLKHLPHRLQSHLEIQPQSDHPDPDQS
ncbi:V-set domain-containing T-cell activation inhibitor 1-like [Seriola lalandi dorsalis]|uniref:V-set domain-containing T-cell activation inhibitor 1-like n=1 Tax=Seriola lalandi dorsalis TaxID=1841481 RepID=UPI000C6FC3B8|nr:V-set domain-containing T-cell activation inhibitor 1-like [Seriola lalandi dorsalis]